MKRFFDRVSNCWFDEDVLRKNYLKCELGDIETNIKYYIDKSLSIDTQCDYIKLAINGPIKTVVDKLNILWGYELVPEENYYMEQYTLLSSKVGELEEQLEETKKEIEKVQWNINRLEEEN